jgi:hypothetical protein
VWSRIFFIHRQAGCYESHALTRDVLQESFEQPTVLCFQDEFSGIVRMSEDYYKFFGEAKSPAGSETLQGEKES